MILQGEGVSRCLYAGDQVDPGYGPESRFLGVTPRTQRARRGLIFRGGICEVAGFARNRRNDPKGYSRRGYVAVPMNTIFPG